MFREITLGQYYSTDSFIHKLDPRVKIFGTFIFMCTLFMAKSWIWYVIAAFSFGVVLKCSKVPFHFVFKGLKSVLWILVMAMVFNVLFFKSDNYLIKYGIIGISIDGIENAALMAFRLILLVLGTSIMTFTTTPSDLTDGIEKAFSFLQVIKVPVSEIAMMMSIALRFIPILIDETNRIMKAQESRGIDFKSGNIVLRVNKYIPIIIPLFVSAFRRADELALAMEARCYRPGVTRTKLNPLIYKRNDKCAYFIIIIYAIFCVILNVCVNFMI